MCTTPVNQSAKYSPQGLFVIPKGPISARPGGFISGFWISIKQSHLALRTHCLSYPGELLTPGCFPSRVVWKPCSSYVMLCFVTVMTVLFLDFSRKWPSHGKSEPTRIPGRSELPPCHRHFWELRFHIIELEELESSETDHYYPISKFSVFIVP